MGKYVGFISSKTHTSAIGGGERRAVDVNKIVTDANRPELSLPTARVDAPVPYVVGRVRVTSPNFIWYGNIQNIIEENTDVTTETKKTMVSDAFGGGWVRYDYVTTTTLSRKVVGYTVDYALAICLGPGVELLAIYSGDVAIWEGALGAGRTVVSGHDVPELGTEFIYHSGEFDQAPDPYLLPIVGADNLPGYVGIAYLIVKGVDASLVSGGNLSFEVRRLPNPLALATGNVLNGNDLNPASAMADIMLNLWGAIGLDPAHLGTASFAAAAPTFFSEGIGSSFVTYAENFGITLLRAIQDQTRSIVFVDPDSNTIELKPLRAVAFDPGALVSLGNNNIASVQRMEKSAWAELPTHFKVEYNNRATQYAADKLMQINPAVTPSPTRERRVATVTLTTANEASIAAGSLALYLTYEASPQLSFVIQANREAADLLPGDTVLVSYDEYGLVDFPATVMKVREQGSTSNAVVVEVMQYENTQVSDFHTIPEPSLHVPIDLTPKTPPDALIIDAPYYFLERTGFEQPLQYYDAVSFPMVQVAGFNDYQITADLRRNSDNALLRDDMVYPLSARLVGTISEYDGFIDYMLSSITIDNVVNAHLLVNQGVTGVRGGNRLIMIDNEILSYETFTDNGNGSYTLNTVYRALIDTALATHADNARVFIIDESPSRLIQYKIDEGATETFAIYSRSHKGLSASPLLVAHTAEQRSNAPYRPTMCAIEGVRSETTYNVDSGGNYLTSFTQRPRNIRGVVLANDPPDPVLSYEVLTDTTDIVTVAVVLYDSGDNYFFLGTGEYGEVSGVYAEFTPFDLRVPIPPAALPGDGFLVFFAVRMEALGATPVADQETKIVQWSYAWDQLPIYINPAVALVAEFGFDYEILN